MSDIKIDAVCIECESNNIFFDKQHYEIYCSKCGLVLVQLHKFPNENLLTDYNFIDFKEMQDYKSIEDLFFNF